MPSLEIPTAVIFVSKEYGNLCFRHAVLEVLSGKNIGVKLKELGYDLRDLDCSLCDREESDAEAHTTGS